MSFTFKYLIMTLRKKEIFIFFLLYRDIKILYQHCYYNWLKIYGFQKLMLEIVLEMLVWPFFICSIRCYISDNESKLSINWIWYKLTICIVLWACTIRFMSKSDKNKNYIKKIYFLLAVFNFKPRSPDQRLFFLFSFSITAGYKKIFGLYAFEVFLAC